MWRPCHVCVSARPRRADPGLPQRGTTRDEHPAVPLTPAELAAEARAAQLAGAQALPLHPRDRAGQQTLAVSDVFSAVAAVRAATGLPVGVTTGIWTVDGDDGRRMSLVADRAAGRNHRRW